MGTDWKNMEEFRFENTVKLTETQYVGVWALLSQRRLSKTIRVVVLAAVGVVFLFTAYTLLLGVVFSSSVMP